MCYNNTSEVPFLLIVHHPSFQDWLSSFSYSTTPEINGVFTV